MSEANAAEPRVLVVDDDPIVADSLAEFIRGEGGAAATAQDGGEALAALRDARPPFQLVLADMNMPRMDGMALLKQVRRRHPDVAVVVITGYGTIESAVEAVQQGAFDYLTKPIVDEEIRETIARALEQRVLRGVSTSESDDRPTGRLNGQVIGRDYRMQKLFDLVEAVADSRTTVLISGESGTGKSMVARAIHQQSSRAEKPFVTMACGSIPETLLESELFGHVKGAFTGADRDKQGKLLAAHEGTLFLDEINSATPALQLKLLRVLQEKQFEPVGSSETVSVDVRFVLASNASLEALVREGQFREDLYYRINVVNLELPPLRQRESDIPLLVEHFLEKYSRETGRTVTGVDEEVMRLLRRYTWPGNVRELENAIERAVVLSSAPVIDAEVLPEKVRHQQPDGQPGFREKRRNPQGVLSDRWTPQPLREALREPEKRIILAALQANDWNRQKTAEVLDINRTTLYKKIKQYDLETLAAEG